MRAAITLALTLLAACGGGADEATRISITGGDNGSAFTAGVARDGEVSVNAPGFRGAIKLPKFRLDAGDFDIDGVGLPEGSKISSMAIAGDGKAGGGDKVRVDFTSPIAPAAVREWFAGKLAAKGFKLTAVGDNLSGTTDEGKPFTLTTKAAGAGSQTLLAIGGGA